MDYKETKKSVVDNVVVAVLLCDYSPLLRCPLIIGGDFNIHVEDLHDADAVSLAEIFELFGPRGCRELLISMEVRSI